MEFKTPHYTGIGACSGEYPPATLATLVGECTSRSLELSVSVQRLTDLVQLLTRRIDDVEMHVAWMSTEPTL